MSLLAALVVPWLSGMVAPCVLHAAAEPSHCLQQPLKKPDAPASRLACHEVMAKVCIHCADIPPAMVQMTPTPSAEATPVLAVAAFRESSATHLFPAVAYTTSLPTPLESILSNRVLLI